MINTGQPRHNAEIIPQMLAPETYHMFRNAESIIKIIVSWNSLVTEVFVRKDFGSRYVNLGRILLALITIQLYGLFELVRQSFFQLLIGANTPVYGVSNLVIFAFLGMSAYHLIQIHKRNNQGIAWHSRSFGESRFNFLTRIPPIRLPWGIRLEITEALLYRVIEPAICYALVYALFPEGGTRSFLLFASLCMAIHANMVFSQQRERTLDIIDARIAANFYSAIGENGRTPYTRDTAGFTVIPVPQSLRLQSEDREATIEIMPEPSPAQPV